MRLRSGFFGVRSQGWIGHWRTWALEAPRNNDEPAFSLFYVALPDRVRACVYLIEVEKCNASIQPSFHSSSKRHPRTVLARAFLLDRTLFSVVCMPMLVTHITLQHPFHRTVLNLPSPKLVFSPPPPRSSRSYDSTIQPQVHLSHYSAQNHSLSPDSTTNTWPQPTAFYFSGDTNQVARLTSKRWHHEPCFPEPCPSKTPPNPRSPSQPRNSSTIERRKYPRPFLAR